MFKKRPINKSFRFVDYLMWVSSLRHNFLKRNPKLKRKKIFINIAKL